MTIKRIKAKNKIIRARTQRRCQEVRGPMRDLEKVMNLLIKRKTKKRRKKMIRQVKQKVQKTKKKERKVKIKTKKRKIQRKKETQMTKKQVENHRNQLKTKNKVNQIIPPLATLQVVKTVYL